MNNSSLTTTSQSSTMSVSTDVSPPTTNQPSTSALTPSMESTDRTSTTTAADDVDADLTSGASDHEWANHVVHNDQISFDVKVATFGVHGTRQPRTVTLFPKVSCSCPATSCYHIMAACIAVGMDDINERKTLNLMQLRKHLRKRVDKKGQGLPMSTWWEQEMWTMTMSVFLLRPSFRIKELAWRIRLRQRLLQWLWMTWIQQFPPSQCVTHASQRMIPHQGREELVRCFSGLVATNVPQGSITSVSVLYSLKAKVTLNVNIVPINYLRLQRERLCVKLIV